jgi:ABC-type transport system involved in multi-copper enzyme maturation permease subunit
MQAFLAILRYDAGQLARSWIARLWLPLLLIPALFLVVVAGSENELASETMGAYVAAILLPISAIAIAVLTTSAISGELNVISDGILSRSVTRSEYLWAKIAARIGFSLGVYLLVMLPFAYLVTRYAAQDASAAGIAVGIIVVAVLLVFIGSVGIALSTIFPNTLLSVLILLVVMLFSGVLFQFLGVRWLSATAIASELPATFRGQASAWDMIRVVIVFGALAAGAIFGALWVFRTRDL